MIKELLIKNFILIDEIKLSFDNGFNVFIGETGAGKSIILKAIDVALGAKTNKDALKDSAKHALVEVTFENEGIETIISREISATGTKCRLNGALVTLETIKDTRENLVDIHSQHQSYTTLQSKYHIELLDAYICKEDIAFRENLQNYKTIFKEFKEIETRLNRLSENNKTNLQKLDFLKFQIDEIENAEIKENEEEDLNKELEILSNIEELKKLTYGAYWTLGADSSSVLEALNKIKYSISRASGFDNSLKEVETGFVDAVETLKDTTNTLRNYSEALDYNPEQYNNINERLELIEKLKRKYGNIFEALGKFQKEFNDINLDTTSLNQLEEKINVFKDKTDEIALQLSAKRKEYAKKLSSLITDKLKKLEFQACQFQISVKEKDKNLNGIDDVEFLISTNVSSSLMPLIKVASGGEISRVMLAIKCVFSNSDKVKTLIFDEIDTGISGKASIAVSNAIVELSNSSQIFAVTHQPIIASFANSYYWVMKKQENSTQIIVKKLSEDEKPSYLAMLATGEANESSIMFAKELLNN